MSSATDGPSAQSSVVIAILTWNGYAVTRACLESLPKLEAWPLPVVVIDNGSLEAEGERLAEEFGPPVSTIRLDPNRGVPGGYNAGLARGAQLGATHVLLMNNDTLITDPAMVSRLVAAADADVAAAAPLTLDPDGRVYSAGGKLSWWTGLALNRRRPIRTDGPYEATWLDGPCLLVSIEAARRVGGFDETYVTYWEDVDWCVRARRAGYRLVVEPRTSLVHLRGVSRPTATAERMHLRNRLLFMRRNGSGIQNIVSTAFFVIAHVPAFIGRRARSGVRLREATRAVIGAIAWNLADARAGRGWRRPARGSAVFPGNDA